MIKGRCRQTPTGCRLLPLSLEMGRVKCTRKRDGAVDLPKKSQCQGKAVWPENSAASQSLGKGLVEKPPSRCRTSTAKTGVAPGNPM